MHIQEWEASRSGAGIIVTMTDAGGVKRKQLLKKIVAREGFVQGIAGDGARFPLALGRETSAEVAAIAGELLNLTADELDNIAWHDPAFGANLLEKIHKVAASALGQRAERVNTDPAFPPPSAQAQQ